MKEVSDTYHLQFVKGACHYIRRVPVKLVPLLGGKKYLKKSFGAVTKAEAKKLRAIEDVKADALFASLLGDGAVQSIAQGGMPQVSDAILLEHVRQHVTKADKRNAEDFAKQPPADEDDLSERLKDATQELHVLKKPGNRDRDERVALATDRALRDAGVALTDREVVAGFAEIMRRGMVELAKRRIDRYEDRHDKVFHDDLFDPARPPAVTFGEVVDMFTAEKAADYAANGVREKSADRIKAITGYLKELIGEATPVASIDDDIIQTARAQVAATPSNRGKVYPGLSLAKQIEKAAKDGKPLLSPATQSFYLDSLRDVLKVAVRKRLMTFNPAEDAKPLKKVAVSAEAKRLPWTPGQIKDFFTGKFYQSCTPDALTPYTKPDRPWRFWLPLIMLFSGARPNEILQLEVGDIRKTKAGVWFMDLMNEDETKQVKNEASRRRVPIHSELIKLGLLAYVEERRKAPKATGPRLFHTAKPDKYGSFSDGVSKSFHRSFFPQEIELGPRQHLYSLRHCVRDALRRAKAPPEALRLAGWSVSKSASDGYGDPTDPDLLAEWVEAIAYPGLDMSFLHLVPKEHHPIAQE